jgi:glycerol-3-phosphate dehydrogenase
LTTYRLMAEEVVDLVANRLKILTPSSTRSTQLPSKDERTAYHLPDRLDKLSRNKLSGLDLILCECELVSSSDFLQALQSDEVHSIDDIRRDLRLGMGTCQAAFCGYRATGLLEANDRDSQDMLAEFTEERWKGIQPLSWGTSLRQIEMLRRFNLEFLHVPKAEQ